MENENPNYYGVMPASVRYDKELSASAKVFYTEVSALANLRGICWATNKYFANLYGVRPTQISEWVRQLEMRGHIRTKTINGGYRGISVVVTPSAKAEPPLPQKRNHNNTVTNKNNLPSATHSFGAKSKQAPQTAAAPHVRGLLESIIKIINPREKVTDERLRQLNARLKDYTTDEITAAAIMFSRSEWHKDNGQMSVDNLIRASKFGRWFAAAKEENPNISIHQKPAVDDYKPVAPTWDQSLNPKDNKNASK